MKLLHCTTQNYIKSLIENLWPSVLKFVKIRKKSYEGMESNESISEDSFYRAMHFSAKRGIAIACRLSVCLSVCDVGEL